MTQEGNSDFVIGYHERTKHHPRRFAKSPGYLDWANEPNPFRVFEGAALLNLPFSEKDPEALYPDLYERGNNVFQPFSLGNIAMFLELSLGLSAWKSFGGGSWALRINPSSGNLHPTEAHLILPPLREHENEGGVFHYNPFFHALEQRASFDEKFWSRISEHFGADGFLVVLSSIYWRESWKYGERAFRYCNHDVGHAVACLGFSANLLGWKATYLNALSDEELASMLGFDKTEWQEFEKEVAELSMFVYENSVKDTPRGLPSEVIESFRALPYAGKPNRLSNGHREWGVIDEVSSLTVKPQTPERRYRYNDLEYCGRDISKNRAAQIIRQRRSGQAYDGRTALSREQFFGLLDRTIPRNDCAPFDAEVGEISIHLLLFVHRVSGLEPGLYFLFRDEDDHEEIQRRCHASFLWERVKDAPEPLSLFLLTRGDFRHEGMGVSCDQEIGGDGVFSVAMIGRFLENVRRHPFEYRRLHWEAGMIGQVLYLEAEAHLLRGTGIGCFFDDLVHQLLGFQDNAYQSIYHFAMGGGLEDKRLTTLPPYHHIKRGDG